MCYTDSRLCATDPSISSSFYSDLISFDHNDPSEHEKSEIETSEANDFSLNESQEKEETHVTSDSTSSNTHSNSEHEIKEPDAEATDSSSQEMELLESNPPAFVVDFDEKTFEDHLKAAT